MGIFNSMTGGGAPGKFGLARVFYVNPLFSSMGYSTPTSATFTSNSTDSNSYSAACTGASGSHQLTLGSSQAILSTGGWSMVLNYGGTYKFINVIAVSGTTVTLDRPLEYVFPDIASGTQNLTLYFSGEYDAGQHLSKWGYYAYAQAVVDICADPLSAYRGNCLYHQSPGPALESNVGTNGLSPDGVANYGGSATNVDYQNAKNIFESTYTKTMLLQNNSNQTRVAIAANQGFTVTRRLYGVPTVVQFDACIEAIDASTLNPLRCQVVVDGVTVYDQVKYGLSQHSVLVQGDIVELRVTRTTGNGYYIRIGEIAFWQMPETVYDPLTTSKKIVLLGDSWFDELGNGGTARPYFASQLRTLTGKNVNASLSYGGMSSKYGAAWVNYAIESNRLSPGDTVIVHYAINDSNSIHGAVLSTVVDPDGNSLDPNIASVAEYRAYMSQIIQSCLKNSVNCVIVGIPTTQSTSQLQTMIGELGLQLGKPAMRLPKYSRCTTSELASATSAINTNRWQGQVIHNTQADVHYISAGVNATDDWLPLTTGTAVTPA